MIWVLLFQLSLGTALTQAAGNDGTPTSDGVPIIVDGSEVDSQNELSAAAASELSAIAQQMAEVADFHSRIDGAAPGSAAPTPIDNWLLNDQGMRVFETVEIEKGHWIDRPVKEYSFTGPGTQLPEVVVTNAMRELEFQYDPSTKELKILKVQWDSKNQRRQITHEHFFKGVELTTESNHFLSDSDFALDIGKTIDNAEGRREYSIKAPVTVLFSSRPKIMPTGETIPSGIRAFLWPILTELVFKAPVPSMVVVPQPPARVVDMEFLTPEKTPQELQGAQSGDLRVSLEVEPPYGKGDSMVVNTLVSRKEIHSLMVEHLRQMFYGLVALSPSPEIVDQIASDLLTIENQKAKDVSEVNAERETILDLGRSSLPGELGKQIALSTNLSGLYDLVRTGGGLDALNATPRHQLPYDQWQRENEVIRLTRDAEKEIGAPAKPWRQILVESYEAGGGPVAAQVAKVEKKQTTAVKKYVGGMARLAKAVLTPKTMLILGTAFSYDITNRMNNGASADMLVSTLSRLLGWTLDAPVIKHVAQAFSQTGTYLHEPWAATRLMVGIGAVLALRPLTLFLAHQYSKIKKTGWSPVKALFTYGTRIYASLLWVGYGPQKLVIEKIMRQKNVYRAVDLGMNPLTTRAAWHAPWASKSKVEEARQKLEKTANADTLVRRARALTLAATIVSEGRGIDVPTLLMATEAAEQNALRPFLETLGSLPAEVTWRELSSKVYAALNDLHDRGVGVVTAETPKEELEAYVESMRNVADEIDRLVTDRKTGVDKKSAVRAARWTKEKAKTWKRLTTDAVLPFFFIGSAAYKERKKYTGFESSEQGGKIGYMQYKEDYDFSAWFYAGTDPRLFGGAAGGNVVDIARVSGDQVEQNLLYGLLNGYDVESSLAADANALTNVFEVLNNDKLILKRIREQTTGEAAEVIVNDTADPNGDSYFAVHQRTLNANLTGFHLRTVVGVIPKTLSLAAIAIAANPGSFATALGAGFAGAIQSVPRQAVIILKKYGISPDGDVGYATVWPGVRNASRALEKNVKANLKKIQSIDGKMASAEEANMRAATRELLDLYRASGTPIPQEFAVSPAEYTPEKMKQLWTYSLSSPEAVPAPTKASHFMQAKLLNASYGALISTVIFLAVSKNFYNPKESVWTQLVEGLVTMAVTYVGVSVMKEVAPKIAAVPAVNWTAKKFGAGLRTGFNVLGTVWRGVTWAPRKVKAAVVYAAVSCREMLSSKDKKSK